MNYFPELEEAAESLWHQAALDPELLYSGLVAAFQKRGIQVRVHWAAIRWEPPSWGACCFPPYST